jgi:hypothetical protein
MAAHLASSAPPSPSTLHPFSLHCMGPPRCNAICNEFCNATCNDTCNDTCNQKAIAATRPHSRTRQATIGSPPCPRTTPQVLMNQPTAALAVRGQCVTSLQTSECDHTGRVAPATCAPQTGQASPQGALFRAHPHWPVPDGPPPRRRPGGPRTPYRLPPRVPRQPGAKHPAPVWHRHRQLWRGHYPAAGRRLLEHAIQRHAQFPV